MLTFCKFRALNMPRSFIESMKWIQGSAIKPCSFYLAHIGRCWCLCDLTHIPSTLLTMIFYIIGMSSLLIPTVVIVWLTRVIRSPWIWLDPILPWFSISWLGVPFASPIFIVVLVPYWLLPWCHYSWWMCDNRVMWILLELWLFVLYAFMRLPFQVG